MVKKNKLHHASFNIYDLTEFHRTVTPVSIDELLHPRVVYEQLEGATLVEHVFPYIVTGVRYWIFLVCAYKNIEHKQKWPSKKELKSKFGPRRGPASSSTQSYYKRMVEKAPDSMLELFRGKMSYDKRTSKKDISNWRKALLESICPEDKYEQKVLKEILKYFVSTEERNTYIEFVTRLLKINKRTSPIRRLAICYATMRLLYGEWAQTKSHLDAESAKTWFKILEKELIEIGVYEEIEDGFRNDDYRPPRAYIYEKLKKNEEDRIHSSMRLHTFFKLYTSPIPK